MVSDHVSQSPPPQPPPPQSPPPEPPQSPPRELAEYPPQPLEPPLHLEVVSFEPAGFGCHLSDEEENPELVPVG